MGARKEHIELNKDFPINVFWTSGVKETEPQLHYHDCLEIDYVEDGCGVNLIEGKKYEIHPGEIYIINDKEQHMGISAGSLKMLVIVFDPTLVFDSGIGYKENYNYLKPFFNREINFSNLITPENSEYNHILTLIKALSDEWQNQAEGFRLMIQAYLLQILALLYRHYKKANELNEQALGFRKNYEAIRPALDYINSNYCENVSLETAARKAHMNRTYFSTVFKHTMNIGFTTYLENLRIRKACISLQSSGKTITDIALRTGFNSPAHFSRVFSQHLGVSPAQYRKQRKPEY